MKVGPLSEQMEGEEKGATGTAVNWPDCCWWVSKRERGGKRLEIFSSELWLTLELVLHHNLTIVFVCCGMDSDSLFVRSFSLCTSLV